MSAETVTHAVRPSTSTSKIGLFERWQKNALRYLVPETGEIFKVPRRSAVGS